MSAEESPLGAEWAVPGPFRRADEQRTTDQHRLRLLLTASRGIIEDLDVPTVVQRAVEVAVEVLDIGYGTIRVHDNSRDLIARFPSGLKAVAEVDEDALFSALYGERAPVVHHAPFEDPEIAAALAGAPEVRAVLSAVLAVRDDVVGRLVLLCHKPFDDEDVELIELLAATAAVAVENSRLLGRTRQRERWANALADVSSRLLSEAADDVLPVILDHVAELVEGDMVAVVVPASEDGMMFVAEARGPSGDRVRHRTYPAEGSIAGRAYATETATLVDGEPEAARFSWQPALGPTAALPFGHRGDRMGVLVIARADDGERFSANDLALAGEFATQASIALELARAQEDRRQLLLSGDRARIARDLHDHVIQRLFAAGLSLQATAGSLPNGVRDRVLAQVDGIDRAISEIRTVVFALEERTGAATSLRHRLIDVVSALDGTLPAPRLSFSGPVDLLVTGPLADEVTAVVREALTNVARHASATSTDVEVQVTGDTLTARVVDDGTGFEPGERMSGTANLAARAAALGGECRIRRGDSGGTVLEWRVPLPAEEAR